MSAPTIAVGAALGVPEATDFILDDATKGVLDGATYVLATGYTTVTPSTYAISIKRGRWSRLWDAIDAGSCNINVWNYDRSYDPAYLLSPYSGYIVPGRGVNVKANGIDLFTGFVDDWDLGYEVDGLSAATMLSTDALGALGQMEFDAFTNAATSANTKLDAICDRTEVGWSTAVRDFNPGVEALASDSVTWGSNVLNYCQLIARSDLGYLFASNDGLLTFRNRNVAVGATSAVSFSDEAQPDPISFPITGVTASYSATRSPAFTLGTAPAADDIIVAYVSSTNDAATTDVSGWTNVLGASTAVSLSDSSCAAVMVYHRVTAVEAGDSTVTWTLTNLWDATETGRVSVGVLRGVATTGELVGSGQSSDINLVDGFIASVTPTADATIVAGFNQDGTGGRTSGDPVGYTRFAGDNTTQANHIYRRDTDGVAGVATGEVAASMTTDDEYISIAAAFRVQPEVIPFRGISATIGSELLFARVGVDREGGTNQTATVASLTIWQEDFGPIRSLSITGLLLADDAQSLALAEYLLSLYGEPRYRISELVVDLTALSTVNQDAVLALDITDTVDVTFTPDDIGDPIVQQLVVQGIAHNITVDRHVVTLSLIDRPFPFFTLDDATYGVLDSDVLGF